MGGVFYMYQITRVGKEPVNIEKVKNYLRISGEELDEDYLLQAFMRSVFDYVERNTGMQINTQLDYLLSFYAVNSTDPQVVLLRPKNSDKEITSVKVGDITLNTDDYEYYGTFLKLLDKPADTDKIEVAYSATIREEDQHKFELPILKIIADAYMNREEQGIESLSMVEMSAQKYLHQLQDASQWIP